MLLRRDNVIRICYAKRIKNTLYIMASRKFNIYFFNIMIESSDIISILALCCVFLRQVNLLLLVPV